MSKQLFTHALDIQAEGIPNGFVPIGTQESLRNFYEALQKKGAAIEALPLYALDEKPPIRQPELTAEFIRARAKELLEESPDIHISPGNIRKRVDDVKRPAKDLVGGISGIMKKASKEGKAPNAVSLLPVALVAQRLTSAVQKTVKDVREEVARALEHQNDRNVIVNDNGAFVSRDWLKTPGNASYVTTFRLRSPSNDPVGPV